jgi:hypothetical protein
MPNVRICGECSRMIETVCIEHVKRTDHNAVACVYFKKNLALLPEKNTGYYTPYEGVLNFV